MELTLGRGRGGGDAGGSVYAGRGARPVTERAGGLLERRHSSVECESEVREVGDELENPVVAKRRDRTVSDGIEVEQRLGGRGREGVRAQGVPPTLLCICICIFYLVWQVELTVKAGRRGARDQEERDVGDGGLTKRGRGRGEAGRAVVQMAVERGGVEEEGRERRGS